jgi:tRNA(adenine34) deaminase
MNDEHWMAVALEEARLCLRSTSPFAGTSPLPPDVPVGAICVFENEIISRGHNRREVDQDPTAHAEVLALRAAAAALGDWHLSGVTLYVTLEPCPMCAGAIWLARVSRVVFGAWDEKAGGCGSIFDIPRDPRLNHRPQIKGGVLENECAAVLQEFFRERRLA